MRDHSSLWGRGEENLVISFQILPRGGGGPVVETGKKRGEGLHEHIPKVKKNLSVIPKEGRGDIVHVGGGVKTRPWGEGEKEEYPYDSTHLKRKKKKKSHLFLLEDISEQSTWKKSNTSLEKKRGKGKRL